MPSFFVHECVALMVMNAFESPHRPAIVLGSCGPDVLYYSTPLSAGALKHLGKRLHTERTGDFLCNLIESCAGSDSSRAYARGFLTHYAADTLFHPFVYALSMTARGYSAIRHVSAERALDIWLAGLCGKANKRGYAGLSPQTLREIADCFCVAAARWAPDAKLMPDDIESVIKRCANVTDVMGALGDIPAPLRISSERGKMQLTPDQLQAFALRGWKHPWTGAYSCDGPFELLGAAIKRSGELISAADGYWNMDSDLVNLRAQLGELSYLSGVDWGCSTNFRPIETMPLNTMKSVVRKWRT